MKARRQDDETVDLAVIGAGPKAAAIAAKAHVLNRLGYLDASVLVLERAEVASTWTGKHGYTTGEEELGTRPEKDVGFPYQSRCYGGMNGAVDAAMQRFSWQSYLVGHGKYRHWIDAGLPQPTHREFAHYLGWVLSQAREGVRVRRAEVVKARVDAGAWVLSAKAASGEMFELRARGGVVMTGAGSARELACDPEIASLVFAPDHRRARLAELKLGPRSRICVVGAGESAATLAVRLIDELGAGVSITIVSPALPAARAESYLENSVYSDPESVRWEHLPERMREEFITRTDRGVMSPATLARLAKHDALKFVLGHVRSLTRSSYGRVIVTVDQSDEVFRGEYDAVANCSGFCPVAAVESIFGQSLAALPARIRASSLARHLDTSFAVREMTPKLHVPALAGLLYGPGFANLSCLGLMSDRVLKGYSSLPPRTSLSHSAVLEETPP